jgi:hypothetical protein
MTPRHGGVGIRRQGDSERGRLRTSDCALRARVRPSVEHVARLNVGRLLGVSFRGARFPEFPRFATNPRISFYSAIFATCTSKPVFGSSEVSANALKPSPLTSVWR